MAVANGNNKSTKTLKICIIVFAVIVVLGAVLAVVLVMNAGENRSSNECNDASVTETQASEEVQKTDDNAASQKAAQEKAAQEKTAAENSRFSMIVGKWAFTAPVGGRRASLTINADGTGVLQEGMSTSSKIDSYNIKFSPISISAVPQAGQCVGFKMTDAATGKDMGNLVYVQSKNCMADIGGDTKLDDYGISLLNQGFKWTRL